MPRVVVTSGARSGLTRCVRFLGTRDRTAAERAARTIERNFSLLGSNPNIGRPVVRRPDLRELVISFGSSGYVALYRYEANADTVYVLAFRHQKEAGY